MTGTDQELKCLICGVAIIHCHLGIDACRACAVFYKRTLNLKRPLKCKGGEDSCLDEDTTSSCRKCRFEKFKDIYDRASAGKEQDWEKEDELSDTDESSEGMSVDEPSPSFIDHNSYFKPSSSSNDTPLLDKMKRAYSALCMVRRSGEMSAIQHLTMHEMLKQEEMTFLPAKYRVVIPNTRIFVSAAIDFARSSFDDFNRLSAASRHAFVCRSFKLMQSLDVAYRTHHHFPNDDTVMPTYTTFLNDEIMEEFFKDCPWQINVKDAVEIFSRNLKRTSRTNKNNFRKVLPSSDEFVALFGLALWNDNTTDLSSDLAQLVDTNRAAIMNELHNLYARHGRSDYATRLGELLCLLVNVESILDLTNEDIQVYRMMNLFNEAFENI